MLPVAHMTAKFRLWWQQRAMEMLFLEALTCRLPGTDGLRGMTPRKGNSLPALTLYNISWRLSEKFSRESISISTGCRKKCLRELLSKLLAACAAPDELAEERSEESPFGELDWSRKVKGWKTGCRERNRVHTPFFSDLLGICASLDITAEMFLAWGSCILTFHLQPGKGAVGELCWSLHPS